MLERPLKHRTFADQPPDAKLCRRPPSPSSSHLPPEAATAVLDDAGDGGGGNVDKVLFRNLVEMVPLVESLMDRRSNSCFTRRASMVYTPAPSPNKKKVSDSKGGKTSQPVSARKQRVPMEVTRRNKNGDSSTFSSRTTFHKGREEIIMLREQVNELQRKLSEKDEALKSAENSIDQMNAVYATADELRHRVEEKESMLKSINSQLYNAKITLADKQAALEKLTWEASMSSRKIEELQGEVVSMDDEITTLMQVFEKLASNGSSPYPDIDAIPYDLEPLPVTDKVEEIDIEIVEEARSAYVAAVAAIKENPSDESFAAASEARIKLEALLTLSSNSNMAL